MTYWIREVYVIKILFFMKLYDFYLQKNLNYYFIVIYTQINFRIFKSFNFLIKNFLKNYKYLVWFDLNYKLYAKINIKHPKLVNNFTIIPFKVIYEFNFKYKYTKYLEVSILNFNINRSVFNELKKNNLQRDLNNKTMVDYNVLFTLFNSINYLYINKFFKKINYLILFKNYNVLSFLNFKYYDKNNLQKNKLNLKPVFDLNFKFL